MGTMEQNKQIVQDGLNKRKARRKKAEEDAYHEAITMQMINIVNAHAKQMEMVNSVAQNVQKGNPVMHASYRRNTRKNLIDFVLMLTVCAGITVAAVFMLVVFA